MARTKARSLHAVLADSVRLPSSRRGSPEVTEVLGSLFPADTQMAKVGKDPGPGGDPQAIGVGGEMSRSGARERPEDQSPTGHRLATAGLGRKAQRGLGAGVDKDVGGGDSAQQGGDEAGRHRDRKSTRLNSSHLGISYAV